MCTPDDLLADTARIHGIRPGLERMHALLKLLDHPERGHRIVHVAGTNGKGSVCAMVAGVLMAAGFRVLRFTSPHLNSYRERFWIDGRWIAPEHLERVLVHVESVVPQVDAELGPVTEFERLTAIAFCLARELAVDWLVLEVGLGGRLDATNVVETPEVSVITRIARDHVDWLGDSIPAIALEKAGILRPGCAAVTAAGGEALEAIIGEARRLNADLLAIAPDVSLRPTWRGKPVEIALAGPYQRFNLAIALAVFEILVSRGHDLSDSAVHEGLRDVRWPGRLERIVAADGQVFILDGAHNVDGAVALASALAPGRRVLVFGALADKEPEALAGVLAPLADRHVLAPVPSPRTWQPDATGVWSGARIAANVPEAIALARECSAGDPIVVAGSLYLVGAVRAELGIVDPEA